jgi:surface protein
MFKRFWTHSPSPFSITPSDEEDDTPSDDEDDSFVFTITIGTTDFIYPFDGGETVNTEVDWGDGSAVSLITDNEQEEATHSYTAGTYQLSATGTTPINFGASLCENPEVVDAIDQWGNVELYAGDDDGSTFIGAENMVIYALDSPALPVDCAGMFVGCESMVDLTGQVWDTSAVTNMMSMFEDCILFNTTDLTTWDVSKVTTMSRMFRSTAIGAADDTTFNGNITGWNIGAVTDLSHMFRHNKGFNQNISTWDTSKVTTMNSMFQRATAFNQNLAAWVITAVTDLADMFDGVTLSTANYDAILIGWGAQAVKNTVTFDAGSSKYTAGGAVAAARAHLVLAVASGGHGWTITDGGTV